MIKSGISLTFTDAMVTKMVDKIGLDKRKLNCHFKPNFNLRESDFLRIRYQYNLNTKQLSKCCVC